MKKISAVMVMGISLLFTIFKSQAQIGATWQTKAIEPYRLEITSSKTTNIIFPYSIVSVDIGTDEVLVQKAKGVENILQIKAAGSGFIETNLTVVTADGKLSSFIIGYAEQPEALNILLSAVNKKSNISLLDDNTNQEEIERFAATAISDENIFKGINDKAFGIQLSLSGLFIHDEILLFRFNIANETNINYDIDQLRLYIRDQKKVKRTARQEIEILPVLVYNNTNRIIGKCRNTFVFVASKFTIPDKKYLVVEMMEKNGGRHLNLKVKNKKLVKARSIKNHCRCDRRF